MSTDRKTITGIVSNGVVVLQAGNELPEGTEVSIVMPVVAMSLGLKEELATWQEAGMHSWSIIDNWEREDQ